MHDSSLVCPNANVGYWLKKIKAISVNAVYTELAGIIYVNKIIFIKIQVTLYNVVKRTPHIWLFAELKHKVY